MTVDRLTYRAIYDSATADYINKGLDLRAAREMAQHDMEMCFQTFDEEIQRDCQHDHDVEVEEMQMTPRDLAAWHNPSQTN
jgi:hypothetical protein